MMDNIRMWWTCPNCGARVNFENQLFNDLFDRETGEANFLVDDEGGIYIHQTECDTCNAYWTLHLSPMRMNIVNKCEHDYVPNGYIRRDEDGNWFDITRCSKCGDCSEQPSTFMMK